MTIERFRWILLAALLLCQMLGHELAPAVAVASPGKARSADDAAIRAMLAAQAEAWNRGDAATWSKPFAQDADFVNIFGMVFTTRKEIEDRHAAIFVSIFKGSHTTVEVRRMVFLTPRLAVVDTDHVVTGYGALPATLHPVDGALRTRMKYVMQKRGTGWSIIAAQNTELKPPPAPRPAAAPKASGALGQ
jgi:uncharacterized protein (TIGR02246 family)